MSNREAEVKFQEFIGKKKIIYAPAEPLWVGQDLRNAFDAGCEFSQSEAEMWKQRCEKLVEAIEFYADRFTAEGRTACEAIEAYEASLKLDSEVKNEQP